MKNVLDEDIKKGEFSTVYLLYGEEEFLKQSYKKQLRSAIAGDDTMNLNIFTGRDIDVREIINLSETMPFFADRRLILVEDSGFFKKGQEELAEYLPKVPESTCIVFVEQEVDKRNRLYKAVKEHGRIAELARQEEKDLIMWAARYLKKNGKSVSASTLEELLMRTGQDMNNIMSELDKLFSTLYEDRAMDRITDRNYQMMSDKYETEQLALAQRLKDLDTQLNEARGTEQGIQDFIRTIREYEGIQELTPAIVNSLIDRITIEERHMDQDGNTVQGIKIYYKFVGSLDELHISPTRRYAAPFPARYCEVCGEEFVPGSAKGKYCKPCAKKVHDRQSNESKRRRHAANAG